MIADTMLPAAPVTTKTGSGPRNSLGLVGARERALGQAHAPAPARRVADLDTAGVAQRLVDQHLGQR